MDDRYEADLDDGLHDLIAENNTGVEVDRAAERAAAELEAEKERAAAEQLDTLEAQECARDASAAASLSAPAAAGSVVVDSRVDSCLVDDERDAVLEEHDSIGEFESPRGGVKGLLTLHELKEREEAMLAVCGGYSPNGVHKRLAAYAFKRNTRPVVVHDVAGGIPANKIVSREKWSDVVMDEVVVNRDAKMTPVSPNLAPVQSPSKNRGRIRYLGLDGLKSPRGYVPEHSMHVNETLLKHTGDQKVQNGISTDVNEKSTSVVSPLNRRNLKASKSPNIANVFDEMRSDELLSGSSLRSTSLTARETMRLNTRNSPAKPVHKFSHKNVENFQRTANTLLSVPSWVTQHWSHVLPKYQTACGNPLVDVPRHIPNNLLQSPKTPKSHNMWDEFVAEEQFSKAKEFEYFNHEDKVALQNRYAE
eukprot:GDKK01059186.1.p1 GENE.GDKK01059186.1~~GDKK01059186.1.p1  ORF type:complete len:445 (+),score=104.83 GDKK01059186.1:77-1336(+)